LKHQEHISVGSLKYNTATLPNGLRVIHLPSSSPVVYCGYQIAAGTRHEQAGEEGLAHFCEHVTFKGTARRNALQIINALEKVGGELNAFTNKEDTTFYAAIHRDHFLSAFNLLTDIVFNSLYPQAEIDKEVQVVCDEIESYNDSPAELIYDEFENILFANHPLGHNILGEAEHLRTYTTADAQRFTRRHYRADNAVFFAYGDISFSRLLGMLAKNATAATLPAAGQGVTPAARLEPLAPGHQVIVRHKDTHQAHVMMGCRAYHFNHPRRMALYLLNNLLGGPGMNSLLNLSLREKRGLVYNVEANVTSYTDTGVFSIYFGCDPKDVDACDELTHKELRKLRDTKLSSTQLVAVKKQIIGQLGVAGDNFENNALEAGKIFLHYNRYDEPEEIYSRIQAITAEELQEVANEKFDEQFLSTLIYAGIAEKP
jgi:predicted Zn-dependent peptidase